MSVKSSNNTTKQEILAEHHSLTISPIPTPEEFAKYKEVMPDLPERIIAQFEKDSENIRQLQQAAQQGDISFDKRSQYMAFMIILIGLIGTFILAYLDKDAAALITGLGTIVLIFKGTFSKK